MTVWRQGRRGAIGKTKERIRFDSEKLGFIDVSQQSRDDSSGSI